MGIRQAYTDICKKIVRLEDEAGILHDQIIKKYGKFKELDLVNYTEYYNDIVIKQGTGTVRAVYVDSMGEIFYLLKDHEGKNISHGFCHEKTSKGLCNVITKIPKDVIKKN